MSGINIKLRPPDLTDKNFIFNSWLKSYRKSEFAKAQCNAVYFDNYKKIVERILRKSLIIVACNPEDYMQVYGYIVYEELPGNNLLAHYIYVKFPYRKFGVATQLIAAVRKNANPVLISHHTSIIDKIAKDLPFVYDPYKGLL